MAFTDPHREFFDAGLLALWDASADGRLLACNETCAALLGCDSVADATGRDLAACYPDPPARTALVDRLRRERQVRNVPLQFRTFRGEVRHVVVSAIGEFDGRGDLTVVHGYAVDVTDLVERQKQSEKLETIGRLAGGVAHDFNNLLTAILGYAELLLVSDRLGETERNDIEEIQRAGQRAASLTQQLLAFGRRQLLMPKDVDLNVAVAALRTMLVRLIREDIQLSCELSAFPAIVHVDPAQLEQVLLNLVLNARDAMPAGGELRVEVACVPVDEVEVRAECRSLAAERFVRLRVSDTGVGIPAETRAHLFEPFFTTKAVGKGRGLGLASVYGIVRQSNGCITVDSEPGAGTTFTMYFPAAVARTREPERPPIARVEQDTGTILLVEDESAVRAIVATALRRRGYTVIEAAKPSDAWTLFQRHTGEIDLLLTDVVMPEMNGPALAQRLVEVRRDLPILFMSGYADALRPRDIDNPLVGFLSKPFQATDIVARVRELLERGTRPHTRTAGTVV